MSHRLKICLDCWALLDENRKEHECPSESRTIKNHVIKAMELPKINRESSYPDEHKVLVLKHYLKTILPKPAPKTYR